MKLLLGLALFGLICAAVAVPLAKRDIKDDLIRRAVDLEKEAAAESKLLKAEGKVHEAAQLDREVAIIERIVKELEEATDERRIEHLEVELLEVEIRLDNLIKRDERTKPPRPTSAAPPRPTSAAPPRTTRAAPVVRQRRDLKDDLIKRAVDLEKEAATESKKLKDEGKVHEAAQLDREAAIVQRIAKELETATDERRIEHLEVELLEVENRLNDLIKRDERTRPPHPTSAAPPRPTSAAPPRPTSAAPVVRQRRDIKDDLIKRATELEKEATAEVKKLRDAGRTMEAAVLERDAKILERLAKELETATDERQVERLEVELLAVENRVNDLIKRDERTHAPRPSTAAPVVRQRRDLKDDLIKRAVELEKEAATESKKLKDEGKVHEAAQLDREAAIVQRIAKELETATDERRIEHLEVELLEVENRLNDLIKRDERTRPPHPTSAAPPKTTGAATPRPISAAPLVRQRRDLKDDLLKRAVDLEKEAATESKKLKDEGKVHEAAQLDREAAIVQRIAKELETATDGRQVQRLEVELLAVENRLNDLIKRDEQTHPPRPTPSPRPTTAKA